MSPEGRGVPPAEVQPTGLLPLAREERLERRPGARRHRRDLEAEGLAQGGHGPDADVPAGARLQPGDGDPARAAAERVQ